MDTLHPPMGFFPRRARPAPGSAAATPPPAWAGSGPATALTSSPRLRRRRGSSPRPARPSLQRPRIPPSSSAASEDGSLRLRPSPLLCKLTCVPRLPGGRVTLPHTVVALGRPGVVGVGTLPSGYVIKVVRAGLLSPSPPPHGAESRRVLVPMGRSSLSRRAGLELGGGGRSRGARPP